MRRALGFGIVVGLFAVAAGCAAARVDPWPPSETLVYPVKFVCGSIAGQTVVLSSGIDPNMGTPATEPPVKPGNYATAVNILNFHGIPIHFRKRATVALSQREHRGRVSAWKDEQLLPGQALEVDCPDIDALFVPTVPANGDHLRQFAKGFVTVESLRELQIVAVYTAEKMGIVQEEPCDVNPVVLNTARKGQTAGGAVIAAPGTDDDWQVVAVPPSWPVPQPLSYPAYVVADPTWTGAPPGSGWISVNPQSGVGLTAPVPAGFEFEFAFVLGAGCRTARLTMQLAADDVVGICPSTACPSGVCNLSLCTAGVSLNGVPIAGSVGGGLPGPPLQVDFAGPIASAGPFRPGANTVRVAIVDTKSISPRAVRLGVAGSVTSTGRWTPAGLGLSIDVEYVTAKRRVQ